jgi:hypothetical protein
MSAWSRQSSSTWGIGWWCWRDMLMRSQASGVPLGETYACVATLKDGRVIRQRDFLDHAEALKAAGLRE